MGVIAAPLHVTKARSSPSVKNHSGNYNKLHKKTSAIDRSSRPAVFCKKGVLKNYAKFIGKQQCQSLFINKVADCSVIKKQLFSCEI